MAHVQQVRSYREIDGSTRPADTVVEDDRGTEVVDEVSSGARTAARVVWFLADILLIILALRFVFALLGANPGNSVAHFIYSVSHPFVAPFFSLFNYNFQNGVARFELYTLVAMAVYALIAWAIARLLTINRPARAV